MNPFVSIVTPFYNTDAYLAECIESVLRQSYDNWELILADNVSTDRSGEIARQYAERDERIHFFSESEFLGQVPNYNRALGYVSGEAKYVKVLQADDLFMEEDSLQRMVDMAERDDDIQVVSGYEVVGRNLYLDGLPIDVEVLTGEEVFELYARDGVFLFGSPTSVLYRASAVREREPFYEENLEFEDTDACFRLVANGKLGFVHQVLTFARMQEGARTPEIKKMRPGGLSRYMMVSKWADRFLPPDEASDVIRTRRRNYYKELGEEAVRLRGSDFWTYHSQALTGVGQKIEIPRLVLRVLEALVREVLLLPYKGPRFIARKLARLT